VIEQLAAVSACDVSSTSDSVQNGSIKSPSLARLSINQVTTSRWSFLDDLISFRELGFEAAGMWRPKVAEFGEERAVELVRDLDLCVSSLSWAGGFTGSDGSSFFDAVDDARQALQLAAQLGAENLVLVSGGRGGHIDSHARRLIVEALKCMAESARDLGVALALQPIGDPAADDVSFLQTLDQTLEVIELFDRRVVRIAFDTFHLWREPRLLDRISELVPYLGVIQLSDSCKRHGTASSRCLPGDGQIPLTEIVHAFDEAGYGGYYELAVWSEDLWQTDYRDLLVEGRSRFDIYCRRPVSAEALRR